MESNQQSKSRKIVLRILSVLVIALLVTTMPDIAAFTHINEDAYIVQAAAAKQKVTFKANGGQYDYNWSTHKYPKTITKRVTKGKRLGKLTVPYRSGYVFTGYYTKKSGGTKYTRKTIVKKNVTLYARWAKQNPKITFNARGGKFNYSWDSYKTVTYNERYGDLPVPTRFDYTFMGWYTKATGGTRIWATSKVKVTKDTKLYARWKVNPQTYLADMPQQSWNGDQDAWDRIVKTGNGFKDQYGTYRYYGYVGSYWSVDTWRTSYVTYDLNKNYKVFRGFLGVLGYSSSDVSQNRTATVKVYGDGKLLWTSQTMGPGRSNQYFNINVKGIKQLRFERNGNSVGTQTYNGIEMGFMDARLIR